MTAGARELIFRRNSTAQTRPPSPHGVTFKFLSDPLDGIRHWRALAERYGFRGAMKAVAKLGTRRRFLYCVLGSSGEVLHDGWLRVGKWTDHEVGPRDVVFGPVRTRHDERARGLATYGLLSAIETMHLRGHRTFVIGTSEDNRAARRFIEKCGFVETSLPLKAHNG